MLMPMRRRRRRQAAAFRFRPYSRKQLQLLTWWMDNSPVSDRDMVIADGAIRSGKTIPMIDGFMTWSMAEFRNENFILAGRTMGALKRNVLNPMFQILNAKGIPYHYVRSEDPRVEIGSNTYYLFGASTEASQDPVQGLTAAGGYGDDAALFPKNFVEQMIGRCSVEGSRLWFNCNPQGPFHYMKTDYIDQSDDKGIVRLKFRLDDNLTLSERVKERYRRMFSGVFYQRNILGMWVMAEGVVYDMWDDDRHKVSTVPASFSEYIIGVDYGTANPCVFLLLGRAGDRWYVVREYYWDSAARGRQKTDSEYADDMVAFLEGVDAATIYVDPSAASFINELRQRGIPVIQADNEVLPGIQTVARLLAADKLAVHDSCEHTLQEVPSYVWDTKAQQRRGEDKPLKQNDHAMDAWRYALHTHIGKEFFFI